MYGTDGYVDTGNGAIKGTDQLVCFRVLTCLLGHLLIQRGTARQKQFLEGTDHGDLLLPMIRLHFVQIH